MFPGSSDREALRRYMALSQVGMEMVAPIVIGAILDYYLGWSPWGVVVGAAIGLFGGLARLVRLGNEANKKDKKQEPPAP